MDWDGDGDLDFFAAYVDKIPQPAGLWHYALGKRHFGFFERLGNNTFRKHQLLQACIDAVEPHASIYRNVLQFELVDWDGDGGMDVLVATYVSESLTVSWANRSAAMVHGEVRRITMIVADDLQPADSESTGHFLGSMKAVDWDLVQLSWAEMAGPDPIAWLVSHYWGMAARHLGEAIRKHAQSVSPDWRDTAYWICTFSNSQWHVKAELGNGQLQEPQVGNTWEARVTAIETLGSTLLIFCRSFSFSFCMLL